jgi:hypothetical protein
MPDVLQLIDGGIPPGGFWFAIVEGDGEGTRIFVRAVLPPDPRRLN